LDVGEIIAVAGTEEVLGSDEGSSKGSDTVERLGELESEVGNVHWGHKRDVRVGGNLESGETTSNDSGADDETTKDTLGVCGADRELGDRPEENGTERVEEESGKNGNLVSASLQNFTSNGRVRKVTDTKVSDLKTGGLRLGDVEGVLEVLVEHIEETIGETPQEEKRAE